MSSYLNGVVRKDFTTADADRVNYQNIIEAEGEGGNLLAVTANLELYEAFIIPFARSAEYTAASAADKIRFLLVSQRTFQREGEPGKDYLTIFEEEYLKEFV